MNHLRGLGLPVLLLVEVAAVRLLHALAAVPGLTGPDWRSPAGWGPWLQTAPPEDALAAVVRLLALGLAWWLLLSTLLAVVAAVSRWRPAVGAARVLTIRAVRVVVDRAMVGMLAASVASGPTAAFAQLPASPVAIEARTNTVAVRPPAEAPAPPLPPLWTTRPGSRPSAGADSPGGIDPQSISRPPAAAGPARTHTVRAGQHLWWIAEHTVLTADPSATASQITAYWRELVELNRQRLRSGDPDIVHPGEEIVLPPL